MSMVATSRTPASLRFSMWSRRSGQRPGRWRSALSSYGSRIAGLRPSCGVPPVPRLTQVTPSPGRTPVPMRPATRYARGELAQAAVARVVRDAEAACAARQPEAATACVRVEEVVFALEPAWRIRFRSGGH